MTGSPSDDKLLDHGWRHFEFHAKQRLNLFNFYIVLSGLLVAAWANVMTGDTRLPAVGMALGLLLGLTSVLFWRMDQRNAHLTRRSEQLMARAEQRLFAEGDLLFGGVGADEALQKSWRFLLARQWSHGQSLRVLFLLMGMAGLLGGVYSANDARLRVAQGAETQAPLKGRASKGKAPAAVTPPQLPARQ